MMLRKNLEVWNKIAPGHESTIPLDFAKHLENIERTGAIIELGCGYGRVLRYLADLAYDNVVGVDGATEMLRRAQLDGHRKLIQASVITLPLRDGSFEVAICIGTLNSIPTSRERIVCFNEIARVLRPGGCAIIRDFALTWSFRRIIRYIRHFLAGHEFGNFRSVDIEFHHFRAGEMRQLAADAGLRVVSLVEERFTTMHGNPARGLTVVALK